MNKHNNDTNSSVYLSISWPVQKMPQTMATKQNCYTPRAALAGNKIGIEQKKSDKSSAGAARPMETGKNRWKEDRQRIETYQMIKCIKCLQNYSAGKGGGTAWNQRNGRWHNVEQEVQDDDAA